MVFFLEQRMSPLPKVSTVADLAPMSLAALCYWQDSVVHVWLLHASNIEKEVKKYSTWLLMLSSWTSFSLSCTLRFHISIMGGLVMVNLCSSVQLSEVAWDPQLNGTRKCSDKHISRCETSSTGTQTATAVLLTWLHLCTVLFILLRLWIHFVESRSSKQREWGMEIYFHLSVTGFYVENAPHPLYLRISRSVTPSAVAQGEISTVKLICDAFELTDCLGQGRRWVCKGRKEGD